MSYLIKCRSCGRVLSMSDSLFTGRIQGQLVAVRCKHCKAPIAVDGNATTELTSPLLRAPEEELLPAVDDDAGDLGWRDQALTGALTFKPPKELETQSGVPVTASTPAHKPRLSSSRQYVLLGATLAGVALLGFYTYTQDNNHGASLVAAGSYPKEPSATLTTQAPPRPSPAVESPSPVTPLEAIPVAELQAVHGEAIPTSVSSELLEKRVSRMLRRAARCPQSAGNRGDTELFVTFGPSGQVIEARLEGAPLADAPVERCILDHARALSLPKFAGDPFTIQRTLSSN